MSHTFYNDLWASAQKDYREIIKAEKKTSKVTGDKSKILSILTELCYKYVAIYDKMDKVYDQMVHPQKLPLVRRVLDLLIARILEIKDVMVKAELSEHIYPDLYQHWLHLIPDDLDIKIPKYYKHGRGPEWLEHQVWLEGESVRKEAEEKEAALDAEINAEEEEGEQSGGILATIKTELEDDIDITLDQAIRSLQTMERARQGRARYALVKYFVDEEEAQRRKKKQLKLLEANRGDPYRAIILLQRAVRRFLARRRVQKMREKELEFIGLSWGPYMPNSPLKEVQDKIKEHKKFLEKVLERRRRMQRRYQENYIEAKETIEKRLRMMEAPEMGERMKWQIRTWALEQKEKEGKVPDLPKDEHGGSKLIFCPDELSEEMIAKAKKDGKKKGKKNKKDRAKAARARALKAKKAKEAKKKALAKKKKKGKDSGTVVVELEEPKHLEDMTESNLEYNKVWRRRDETNNPEQRHEDEIITREKRDLVGQEVREAVDKMMRAELKVLKAQLDKKKRKKGKKKKGKGRKKKKSKRGKKGKKKRRKGKKKKKDMTKDRTLKSLFEELVRHGIIRRYPKVNLNDLQGEPSIINGAIRKHWEGGSWAPTPYEDLNARFPGDANPPPTFGDVKRAIKDVCILPIGSHTVHALGPFPKSVLLAGPPGTGKHTLVNAICTELGATLFDLSAKVVKGKYPGKGKTGLKMLMHMVGKVGTLCGPSVVLIDNCEKMFQKRLSEDDKKLEPKRLKKSLKKFLKKEIGPDNPILLIGISNQPWKAKGKAFKKLFQRIIYIPRPEYGSRLNWWRETLGVYAERFDPNLNFSLLAKLSDSWTLGSIKKAVNSVMKKFGKSTEVGKKEVAAVTNSSAGQKGGADKLKGEASVQKIEVVAPKEAKKPLITMNDLLKELSQQDPVFVEQEKVWTKWFNKTTLQKARLRTQVNGTGKKKKGKGKGKGKGRGRGVGKRRK